MRYIRASAVTAKLSMLMVPAAGCSPSGRMVVTSGGDPDDVLVMRPAWRERQLHGRGAARLASPVAAGELVPLGVGEQVREAAGHAGRGPGRGSEPQLEVAAVDGRAGLRVQADADLGGCLFLVRPAGRPWGAGLPLAG
jgi:hypothetical protein